MIRVDRNIALTVKNVAMCYKAWLLDYDRIKLNDNIFTNSAILGTGEKLKLPFGKKLTITSAAATLGDGITVSAPEDLAGKQKATFDAIQDLFNRQTIINHDTELITDMVKHCKAYELVYMSEDEIPIPKTAEYNALSAFVVFDDTAEANSLFACYVDSYNKGDVKYIKFSVIDNKATYEKEILVSDIKDYKTDLRSVQLNSTSAPIETDFILIKEHPFGRVPMTEVRNNKEEQGDFEQLIDLMKDRTVIHNKNFQDLDRIAKNYLEARNTEVAGITEEEKNVTQKKMADTQRYSYKTDKKNPDSRDGINIVSKSENYSSVTEFGKDIDSKIYDLSMIIDLTSQEFAGNVTGVALKQKFFVFINMVKRKNAELEKMYKRRLKMYMTALVAKKPIKYELFDVDLCTITFNRNWVENITELATLIQQLLATGLYSDKYLTNKMPDADYDEEQAQLKKEREEKAKNQSLDPNNTGIEEVNSILRGMQEAEAGNANVNTN